MGNFIDLTGKRFGRWTVVGRSSNHKSGQATWICRCDCGTEKPVMGHLLRIGRSTSCGCYRRTILLHKTHGRSLTPEYKAWGGMISRCSNPRVSQFKYYGERGITVCDRWRKFENFYADMGSKPIGRKVSLGRINNDGNYEPGNCRWETVLEQENNKSTSVIIEHEGLSLTVTQWARRLRVRPGTLFERIRSGLPISRVLTNHSLKESIIEYNGVRLTKSQWAEKTSIKPSTLSERIRLGWSIERALTTPTILSRQH